MTSIICKSRCKYFLYVYRNKFQFLLFHVVYKYCYSNSYLTNIYVEESVTDIMKHPVCQGYNYPIKLTTTALPVHKVKW